jgi:hypothetical protein
MGVRLEPGNVINVYPPRGATWHAPLMVWHESGYLAAADAASTLHLYGRPVYRLRIIRVKQ